MGTASAEETLVPNSTPEEATRLAEADRLIGARRWGDAAALLSGPGPISPPARLKRNLARNLAALQRHRPAAYEAVLAAPATGRYRPIRTAGDSLALAVRTEEGLRPMVAAQDSAAEAARTVASLDPAWPPLSAAVLAGVADGHLLARLARDARLGPDGSERPVLLVEPDVELFAHVLLIHDLAGPDGPIEQGRFGFFLGESWASDLRETLEGNAWLASPDVILKQGERAEAISRGVKEIGAGLQARREAFSRETHARYRDLEGPAGAARLARLFGENPPRPPRVLLPASRFTTVLRHAYRDAAAGFEQLGWEVRLVSEPEPWHRLSPAAVREAIREFHPDLVLLIDHLRLEFGNLFPPGLPVATWTQDHLSNLTNDRAGRSVGPRDFVWTVLAGLYTRLYHYPARQCVPVAKLVHVPPRSADLPRHEGDRRELVYVSHASRTPERVLATMLERVPAENGLRSLLRDGGVPPRRPGGAGSGSTDAASLGELHGDGPDSAESKAGTGPGGLHRLRDHPRVVPPEAPEPRDSLRPTSRHDAPRLACPEAAARFPGDMRLVASVE